jgi:hypothetical protein
MTAFLGTNRAAGLFLDAMQAGQTGGSGVTTDRLDLSAAQALEILRDQPRTLGRWRAELSLPDPAFDAVVAHLSRLGMITIQGKGDGATVFRSPDADAKRVMARLATGPALLADVQRDLALTDADMTTALRRLIETGMLSEVRMIPEAELRLTDFARDAVKVFRVA